MLANGISGGEEGCPGDSMGLCNTVFGLSVTLVEVLTAVVVGKEFCG